jgi:serine/threonine protein kinase
MQVGSWLYMAPEMVAGAKYAEKVDVFSLAIMLYEALSFRLNVMKLAMGREPTAISDYAQGVAQGHRENLPRGWPQEVKSLLQDAWAQVRPALLS